MFKFLSIERHYLKVLPIFKVVIFRFKFQIIKNIIKLKNKENKKKKL